MLDMQGNMRRNKEAMGGVDQMTRNLTVEWGEHHIRVNTINHGFTEHFPENGTDVTPLCKGDLEEEIRRTTPLQRRGSDEEIATPAVFIK